ncbi:hypothetical protein BDP27DRAFT_1335180 [Rhodocollybia butyracea]|uniref:F-box domain-containing protein n=1 Tax=Rhodocollybia butyracea TaxID=206335 RepID=A0A9P5PHJ2_9AGAR|nr:hypothetical protein BDP27DRAFT_1335180 [Rhodocollybia butyracea]
MNGRLRHLYRQWKSTTWLSLLFQLTKFFFQLRLPIFTSRRPAFPELPVEILSEIFQFATYLPESESFMPLDPFTPQITSISALGPNTAISALRTKSSIVLVCREWWNIATPVLYRHLAVRSPQRALQILSALEPHSRAPEAATSLIPFPTNYGQHTRYLEVYTHSRGCDTLGYLKLVCQIIQYCPNLRNIRGCWRYRLPPGFLDFISRMCGPTLQGISWVAESRFPEITNFFGSFQSLRVLDVSGNMFEEGHSPSKGFFVLPLVHDLIVSTRTESLLLASSISMPNLHKLVLRVTLESTTSLSNNMAAFLNDIRTFLNVNGAPLRTLHIITPLDFHRPFLVCMSLETVVFNVNFTPKFQHPSVRRVGLYGVILGPEKFDNKNTISCLRTLAHSHGSSPDDFIHWSEKFERQGVDFQDGAGVVWLYTEVQDEGGSSV